MAEEAEGVRIAGLKRKPQAKPPSPRISLFLLAQFYRAQIRAGAAGKACRRVREEIAEPRTTRLAASLAEIYPGFDTGFTSNILKYFSNRSEYSLSCSLRAAE
ncbi:MAG: hypothetical protein JO305_03130 [Alphaproteobacteria bacterium]|nr:hypothetical protein [Alphaproteobacteria bacterium]